MLALLAACSPAEPVASTTSSAPPPTTKAVPASDAPALGASPGSQPPTTPQPPPPQSPDKVTSACPFLGVNDVRAAMGAALDAWAEEAAPDRSWRAAIYRCDYPSRVGGRQIHQLYVAAVPGTGRFDAVLKEWSQECADAAVPVAGVTGTARTCSPTTPGKEGVVLMVAKKSHGETRLAELDLRPQRTEVYAKIAQLLLDRL
ncbi:hypothetical protein [Amycolatopsis sp. lyj-109]|uniref:hypothetical protein n=1 Tax=Amycolatopsis sp. lyj-109 TaxID=2789287 RepID=UPI00397D1C60